MDSTKVLPNIRETPAEAGTPTRPLVPTTLEMICILIRDHTLLTCITPEANANWARAVVFMATRRLPCSQNISGGRPPSSAYLSLVWRCFSAQQANQFALQSDSFL